MLETFNSWGIAAQVATAGAFLLMIGSFGWLISHVLTLSARGIYSWLWISLGCMLIILGGASVAVGVIRTMGQTSNTQLPPVSAPAEFQDGGMPEVGD